MGFGARLEARARLDFEARTSRAQRLAMYTSFVDTVLRGFKGVRLIQQGLRAAGAFEAEAERWVERAWSSSSDLLFGDSSSGNSSNSNSNSSSSSSSSANGTHAASMLGGALTCLSRLYRGVMASWDARPASFIAEPPPRRA